MLSRVAVYRGVRLLDKLPPAIIGRKPAHKNTARNRAIGQDTMPQRHGRQRNYHNDRSRIEDEVAASRPTGAIWGAFLWAGTMVRSPNAPQHLTEHLI